MTIEEALKQTRKTKECFVIWNSDTGEPIEVLALAPNSSPGEQAWCLERLQTEFPGINVAGKYFESRQINRSFFERLVTRPEEEQVSSAWYAQADTAPLTHLIAILERRDYPSFIPASSGAEHLIQTITGRRRQELTPELIDRLRLLATTRKPFWIRSEKINPSLQRTLVIALAEMERDIRTLIAMWRDEIPGCTTNGDRLQLMSVFGTLRVTDPGIIADLIKIVATPNFFTIRFVAMMALGRIGPPAGISAVETIRRAIHDSDPTITRQRERVCARILAPEESWFPAPPVIAARYGAWKQARIDRNHVTIAPDWHGYRCYLKYRE